MEGKKTIQARKERRRTGEGANLKTISVQEEQRRCELFGKKAEERTERRRQEGKGGGERR